MPNGRLKDVAMLVWIVALLLGAAVLAGCASPGQGSPGAAPADLCVRAKSAYAQAQAVVDATDRAVIAEQQALAALPANDPIRKQLEPPLIRASAYLAEVQIASQLARVAVAALCPEIPTPPVVVPPPPATQPTQPAGP